ncbi:MAG: J domain-containing protein [Chloroflexota bacterium]
MSVSDPYKVLQVDPEAEREVIEAAYRRLARKYHPDVSTEPDSHDKMIAINQAWEQLRDPAKRAAVDRARQRATGTAAWVAASDAQVRTAGPGHHGPIRQAAPRPEPRPAPPPSNGGAPGPGGGQWPFGMSDPAYGASGASSTGSGTATGSATWATGRVPIGGFASGLSSRPDGEGAAGAPPGNPSGSVLNFGRFTGWSLGEIARTEPEYLEWLDRMPIGRTYQAEIDEILRAKGRRSGTVTTDQGRGGPFRRR